MRKIKLVFGVFNEHNIDSYDFEFERLYQNTYKPFLTLLYNYPDIPITLYYSGILLDWLESKHPEFLMLLKDMIKRKQVELLGGGFYEPVFSFLPGPDRSGQIEELTTSIRGRFGKRPRGAWLTHKIWEPVLSSVLKNAGIDYIFLDDSKFITSEKRNENEIYFPCITEDQGKTLNVYAINTKINSMVCKQSPETVINYMKSRYSKKDRLIVIMQDGESFSNNGDDSNSDGFNWLNKFLDLLTANKNLIETVNSGKYIKGPAHKVKGYFRYTSCADLMKWVSSSVVNKKRTGLGLKEKNLKDGNFRQFLVQYPEANLIYSKMNYTSILVNQIRRDKYRKKAAREELWRGQCHSVFWNSRSGGIYKNNLRKQVYKSFIAAENKTREKGIFIPSIVKTDFDMDGENEFLFQGHVMNAYIHTRNASLFELDYIPASWNYLSTISRHKEIYHDKKLKKFDDYLRHSFIDHFISSKENIDTLEAGTFKEQGSFINKYYAVDSFNKDHKEVSLSKRARVFFAGKKRKIEIQKRYKFKKDSLTVNYIVKNLDNSKIKICFAPEINLSFASRGIDSLRLYQFDGKKKNEFNTSKNYISNISEILTHDVVNDIYINIASSNNFDLFSFPVESITLTERGFETFYQSSCFIKTFDIELNPEELWGNKFTLSFIKE